jgi:predicted ribosomally synthesized peptide with nif11-like leader
MGLESAQAFWTRVRDDSEFRQKLASATSDQELERIIVEAGFSVTGEELKTSLAQWKAATAAAGQELSEEQLEKVAGGSIQNPYQPGLSLMDFRLGMKSVAPLTFKG